MNRNGRRWILSSLLVLALWPAGRGDCFSDDFKKKLTEVHSRILLKGEKFTPQIASNCWSSFDDEAVRLLAAPHPSEGSLNGETKKIELSVTERGEAIELGTVEMAFGPLGSKNWLVSYQQVIGTTLSSTFHIFRCEGSKGPRKCQRIGAFEEQKGPWDRNKLLATYLQLQLLPPTGPGERFASFHLPRSKKADLNRSQIIWEFGGGQLKPVLWVPEVDWHVENGTRVEGRGASVTIP